MNLISIEHLGKKYGTHTALQDVSCELEPGINGLLGHNGAGKSTLMKLMCDQIRRDAGKIQLNGRDILDMGENYRAMLGYLPQQQGLYESMPAESYLRYIATIKGVPSREAGDQIDHLLELFHLENDRSRKLRTFSGGMRQRVMLAQTFLGKPKIIILDEPTVGLDPGEQQALCRFLRGYDEDAVILWSTHIVREIEAIADRTFVMRRGKIVCNGTVNHILEETGAGSLSDAYTVLMGGF